MLEFELLILGTLYGLLYGVLALGLTIIWGVMKVVNIAHGYFVMIGAYASYLLFVITGLNPILSLLLTIPVGFALGALTYLGLVRRVQNGPELMSLLLTYGLATVISGLLLFAFSPTQRAIPFFLPSFQALGTTVPENVLIAAVYAVSAAVAVEIFLAKSFWGKAIRAVIENRTSALLVGINPNTVSLLTFAIGIGIASSVGSIVMLLQSVSPETGPSFTLVSFAIVVLGGLGSPVGALMGGVIIGVAESLSSLWVNAAVTPGIAFIVLFIVLILRPQGLLGRSK